MQLKSMPSSLANINRSCPGCIKIYNIYTEETKMDNRQYIQNISGEVHGSVNMAGGDISYNNEKTEKIYELLNEIRKYIESGVLDQIVGMEEKENVIDDIQTIEEQCHSENVSTIKVRKALNGLKSFVTSLPSKIAGTTMLITQVTELQDTVHKFIESLPKL
jgi:hypothetical protein